MLLAGDIGGTKTDLAVFDVEHGPRAPIAQKRFPSRDYPTLEAIASEFIAGVDLPVTHASFAVAGPVVGGTASLTNLPWVIEESSLRTALGLQLVSLLNDVLMFKKSGLSIAMGNASDEVKRQATFVTTSYADEGFANAIERFVLPRVAAAPASARSQ